MNPGSCDGRADAATSAPADGAPVYFLHIPKTAGTTVTGWLSRAFGAHAMCPAKNWDQLVAAAGEGQLDYTLFCGHYGWGLDAFLGKPVRSICVFRDPVQRTISHYRHVSRDATHPRHSAVRGQTLAAFVQDRENWPMIENFQARYLVGAPVSFRRFVSRLDRDPAKLNRLSTASEDMRYLFDPAHVRECAFEALERMTVAGVTEHLPGFVDEVARAFRLRVDPGGTRLGFDNQAPPDSAQPMPDASTLQLIQELTPLDRELHALVLQRAR